MRYQLICMSFNGEYQRERPEFDSIQGAWEYSDDLGSKWFFYPFHFVVRGKTIRATPYGLQHLDGKRIKTVSRRFKNVSERPEMADADMDTFQSALQRGEG